MTRSARLALGAASLLPALTTTVLPEIVAAVPGLRGAEVDLAIGGALVLLAAGLAVVLYFVWLAAGDTSRGSGWQIGWSVGLVLFGVIAAPVFWALYVRRGAPVSA